MNHSKAYYFFFADGWRIAIIILIILAIILFLYVFGKTLAGPKKFKLLYIVMINVMITAILNPTSYFFNWVIYENGNDGELLFGDFLCKFQGAAISSTQTSRETFVTLISIISFISFKYGQKYDIDESKLGLIIVIIIGYLFPIITNIIYCCTGMIGKTQYFCFVNDVTWGIIHMSYVLFLVIVSIIFIGYLIIKTTLCNNEKDDPWIGENTEKHCMNPMLKKIIFFPIAQIFTNCFPLAFRYMDFIKHSNEYSKMLARPAATLNSISSILYTFIFAITNEIFTNFGKDINNKPSRLTNESGLVDL